VLYLLKIKIKLKNLRMKKIIFVFSFLLFGGLAVSAQCTKSAGADGKACCAMKKTASADAKSCSGAMVESAEADAAAAKNSNIQKRVCEGTNKVCYYEKTVCAETNAVSWTEVSYNAAEKKFTKVASASMEKTETGEAKAASTPACSKDSKKACCASKKVN
jgi:hypothetical protein